MILVYHFFHYTSILKKSFVKQEIARAKEAIHKDERHRLVERWHTWWHGEQTGRYYRLISEPVCSDRTRKPCAHNYRVHPCKESRSCEYGCARNQLLVFWIRKLGDARKSSGNYGSLIISSIYSIYELKEKQAFPNFLRFCDFFNWGFGLHNRRSAWPSRQKRGYRNARTFFSI